MISEKTIAEQFHNLWEETLPLLTPGFVRVFNEASREDLTEIPGSKFKRIPVGEQVDKHDLVAELSFQLAKVSVENLVDVYAIERGAESFIEAYSRSVAFLKRYDEDLEYYEILNDAEISEAFELASQYKHYFSYLKANEIEFSPCISGSGFLGLCHADLSVDSTLYEVKTVTRNLAGRDIRQLIIYLALQHSSGTRRWSHAGFLNPRKAIHHKFSVDHLIYRTSGGRSTSEVFEDIIEYLSNRGVEIDAVF